MPKTFTTTHSPLRRSAVLAATFLTLGFSLLARDRPVPSGGDLQSALDAAQPGDSITLAAGATYNGGYILRFRGAVNNYITIRSSAYATFSTNIRVSPVDTNRLATIVTPAGVSGFQAERGANHYRLTGLEVRPAPGAYVYDLVRLGNGDETLVADLPSAIIVDHCYIHGDPTTGSKRGVALNGANMQVRDSYISSIFSTFQDSQAIGGWNGTGPYTIMNNYLEASGENIMLGGAPPALVGNIPSDIVVRGNYLNKPAAWRSANYVVKNLFELKNARNVLIEGNILANSWGEQNGPAVVLTVRTEGGAAPWAIVKNVTFRSNIVRDVNRGLVMTGVDNNTNQGVGSDLTVENNYFYAVQQWGFVLLGGRNIKIERNTVLAAQGILIADVAQTYNFSYRNNVAAYGLYGIFGSGSGGGTQALAQYFPGATVTQNLFFDTAATTGGYYPGGNYFSPAADVGFVDAAGGDYALSSSSPYRSVAGADFRTLRYLTANVITGRPQ